MNNQPPKVLYETVGKYAGINVIFDPQLKDEPADPEARQECIDYRSIGRPGASFRRPARARRAISAEAFAAAD